MCIRSTRLAERCCPATIFAADLRRVRIRGEVIGGGSPNTSEPQPVSRPDFVTVTVRGCTPCSTRLHVEQIGRLAPEREGAAASLPSLGCRWTDVARARRPPTLGLHRPSPAGTRRRQRSWHGPRRTHPVVARPPSWPQVPTSIDTNLPLRSHRKANDGPSPSSTIEVAIR